MECLLMQSGSGFDPAEVTATPGSVKSGKKFLGAGSDDVQTGTLATVPKVDVKLGINESYAIKPGYHTGEDVVSQSGIPTSQGLSINPTAGGKTVQTAGTYYTSDTYVQSIENLRPEVIKDGVVIADITGTYQGFVDEG